MFNSPIDWCPRCSQWVALDDECRALAAKKDACPLGEARLKATALIRQAYQVQTAGSRVSTTTDLAATR